MMMSIVKSFSIYWGNKETMYGACHINGTWEMKEVGQLKLLYKGGKPHSGLPSFYGGRWPL